MRFGEREVKTLEDVDEVLGGLAPGGEVVLRIARGSGEARQIREAFAEGDRAGVAMGVTDRLCDAMAVVGDRETVRARIRAYAEAGVDVCVVNPIADSSAVPQVLKEISGCLDGLDLRNSGLMRATG